MNGLPRVLFIALFTAFAIAVLVIGIANFFGPRDMLYTSIFTLLAGILFKSMLPDKSNEEKKSGDDDDKKVSSK